MRGMTIILMLLERSIWPLAMVKSRHFSFNSSINRSLLLMRWRKAHKSKYHILFEICISESWTILATLRRNNSGSELLLSAAVICRYLRDCWWCCSRFFCCFINSSGFVLFCKSEGYRSTAADLQFLSKCPSFWQLKHLSLLIAFICPRNIITRSLVVFFTRLLRNLTFVEASICWILSIILSLLLSMLIVVVLKLL